MMNLYRPIYDRLEVEVIELSTYILFSDKHLNVTSIKIAELLLRTVSEIENVAKAICKQEKEELIDKKGKAKNLKLHDYLNKIENIYGINSKAVEIVNHNFHFTNLNLTPFEVVAISGENEQRHWHYAYNKLKHDRDEYFEEASLGNLVTALGALFLLNVYISNVYIEFDEDYDNMEGKDKEFKRCGSKLFSLGVANTFWIERGEKVDIKQLLVDISSSDYNEEIHKKIFYLILAFMAWRINYQCVFGFNKYYSGNDFYNSFIMIKKRESEVKYKNYSDEAQMCYLEEYYKKNRS